MGSRQYSSTKLGDQCGEMLPKISKKLAMAVFFGGTWPVVDFAQQPAIQGITFVIHVPIIWVSEECAESNKPIQYDDSECGVTTYQRSEL